MKIVIFHSSLSTLDFDLLLLLLLLQPSTSSKGGEISKSQNKNMPVVSLNEKTPAVHLNPLHLMKDS
ncbi:hypothetical protein EYC84_006725 [Monilinia fructicola]|uniref:Uncharacterized protein n=1 Tax=Monilinia fructicola TaxID=38448 RepID=A0A5M9K8R2_MONFR|nr:hypothetical protein EYC84_006725 [Monilinia fructicola]